MPTFIDESGGTGWRPGSHPFFRLAAVWLPTREVVEACRASIRAVRVKLKLKANHEFKFGRASRHSVHGREFFRAVRAHEFRYVVCAYDKHRIPAFSVEAGGFHWGCSVVLASYLRECYRFMEKMKSMEARKPVLLEELVVVDDNADKNFLTIVDESFRGLASGCRPGGKLVGKVKFGDSRRDELLQLADMIVGSVGAHIDGDSTWFDMIADRSLGVVILP